MIVGQIRHMSHNNIPIYLCLDEIIQQRQSNNEENCSKGPLSVFCVNVKNRKGGNKNLHIILQIPSPSQTHFLPIPDKIVDKKYGFPHILAVGNFPKIIYFVPKRPISNMNHKRPINQNGNDVTGPESEHSVHNSQEIFPF